MIFPLKYLKETTDWRVNKVLTWNETNHEFSGQIFEDFQILFPSAQSPIKNHDWNWSLIGGHDPMFNMSVSHLFSFLHV